jgi:hypothetical protein
MHIRYLGDSYDIVKQNLLRWLSPLGEWAVHPMFTEAVSEAQAAAFARFLGATLVSSDLLGGSTDRKAYFAGTRECGNLFLDPDTGLAVGPKPPKERPQYLFASELVELVNARPGSLTLVVDQSLPRGRDESALRVKLQHLGALGVSSFAYHSHASFILAALKDSRVTEVFGHVLAASHLPASRFVRAATT